MIATTRTEQYLSYYIALESIARHVPGVTRAARRSDKGEVVDGLESQENAAIKFLIARHKGLPASARSKLSTIRARIAHGNADLETLRLASANLPAVQRLAADGIALVYGVAPETLRVLAPSPVEHLAPMMYAPYSPDYNPSSRWGGPLSNAFADYVTRVRAFASPSVSADAMHSTVETAEPPANVKRIEGADPG